MNRRKGSTTVSKLPSWVWLFETPWTIQSVEFSWSEYWSGYPFSRGSSPENMSICYRRDVIIDLRGTDGPLNTWCKHNGGINGLCLIPFIKKLLPHRLKNKPGILLLECWHKELWRHASQRNNHNWQDFKNHCLGLPRWFSGKEFTCQCRRHGFDLWSGMIPYAMGQLSPCTITIELVL